MEWAIGNRFEGAQGGGRGGGGGGGIIIDQGRRDYTTMRGGKEKYNNQQWLMWGVQKEGQGNHNDDRGI
jgi:hypothetical protein